MGALSVVIAAILSHFFLKESLTFFVGPFFNLNFFPSTTAVRSLLFAGCRLMKIQGWLGCVLCIIGATILALNAPEQQSVTTIEGFKALFLHAGFLTWGSICIVASLILAFYFAPRYGKKTMMVYISEYTTFLLSFPKRREVREVE